MRQRIEFAKRPDTARLATDGRTLGFTVNKKTDETIINVSGVIGDEWDGLTAATMSAEIQRIDTPIVLRLNTPGGYVGDAIDIYDALVEHPENVRADIVAEAWSAGTIICAAADEVRIRPAARYGVHCAWSGFVLMGNAAELREQAPQVEAYATYLEKIDVQIAEMIAARSDVDASQVLEWMDGGEGCDGTEFIGVEAVNAGLCDSLIETSPKAQTPNTDARSEARAAARARSIRLAKLRSGV